MHAITVQVLENLHSQLLSFLICILHCGIPGLVSADHGINQDALIVHCCL